MARYFFHIMNSRALIDYQGLDLPDNSQARLHALAVTSQMMSEIDANWKGEEWTMTVTDHDGTIILTLRFSATFGTIH